MLRFNRSFGDGIQANDLLVLDFPDKIDCGPKSVDATLYNRDYYVNTAGKTANDNDFICLESALHPEAPTVPRSEIKSDTDIKREVTKLNDKNLRSSQKNVRLTLYQFCMHSLCALQL